MDDVQIDVVDPEPLQAPLDFRNRVLPCGRELGGEEHLLARDTALAQPLPHAFLVAVRLRRVDVPVPELERPADGAHALGAVRHSPDTEADQRDLVAVREGQDHRVAVAVGTEDREVDSGDSLPDAETTFPLSSTPTPPPQRASPKAPGSVPSC